MYLLSMAAVNIRCAFPHILIPSRARPALWTMFPAIAITSNGIFELTDHALHTENDTLEWIDTEKLEQLVNFLLDSFLEVYQ